MRKNRRTNRGQSRKQFNIADLRNLVIETLEQGQEDAAKVKAEEVDADGFKKIEDEQDHYENLKLKESILLRKHAKLVKEVKRVRAKKEAIKKSILKKLD